MNIFAQIIGPDVANTAVALHRSDLPADQTWIDVTEMTPQPCKGWTYDGQTFIAPARAPIPPPPLPQTVTNFQGRTALRQAGLFDVVQAAITAMSDPQKTIAQDAFDRADFGRNSPLLLAVAAQLGKSSSDIDAIFVGAAKITV